MAALMYSSVGCGVGCSKAAADMIWQDWQYPHCGTSSASHATCNGCSPSGESPSMVVMGWPATDPTVVAQERNASPPTRTVHAPHSPSPHPNLGPLIFNVSRTTHRRGMSG